MVLVCFGEEKRYKTDDEHSEEEETVIPTLKAIDLNSFETIGIYDFDQSIGFNEETTKFYLNKDHELDVDEQELGFRNYYIESHGLGSLMHVKMIKKDTGKINFVRGNQRPLSTSDRAWKSSR